VIGSVGPPGDGSKQIAYSGACLVPNDQQIVSPDVRLTTAPRFTCVNGGLSTLSLTI
jgi:hypothetical protein